MNTENVENTKKILYLFNREDLGLVYGVTQVTILGILIMTYFLSFFIFKRKTEKLTVEKDEKVFDLEAKYLPISFIILHKVLFLLSSFYACEIYLGMEVTGEIVFNYQQYCDLILILFNFGIHIILNDIRKNDKTASLRKVFLFMIILFSLFFEIMCVALDCFKVKEYSFFNLNSIESKLYFALYVLKTLSLSYIFASIFIEYPFKYFYKYKFGDATVMGKIRMFFIKFQMMWPLFWPEFWIPRICFIISLMLVFLDKIFGYYLVVKTSDLIQLLAFQNSSIPTKELLKIFSIYGALLILQGNSAFGDGLISNLRNIAWQPIKNHMMRKISIRVYAHAHGLPITWFLKKNTDSLGDLINRGSTSIDNILSQTMFKALMSIFDLIIAILLFVNLATRASVFIFCATFLAYLFFTYLITDQRSKYTDNAAAANDKAKALVMDAMINYESVKTCGMENFEVKRYSENIDNYGKEAFIESKFLSLTIIAQNLIVIIGFLVGCAFCIRDIMNTETERYKFLIFVTYFQRTYPSLFWLGNHLKTMKTSIKQMDGIINILKENTDNFVEETDKNSPKTFESLELKNVGFKYDNRMILENVNLKFTAGKIVRIIGSSGSGKTTLLRLLSGLLNPTEGKIYLNGIEISRENKGELRRIVSVVPQEITLFNDSIAENIKYGNLKCSNEELAEIEHKFVATKNFTKFIDGLNYKVGERGSILSGGEKHSIGWARAFINNPKILLIDEAKSCLNSELINKLLEDKMKSLNEKCTAVIVTNELQEMSSSDTIVYITEKGVYCGSSGELLADRSNGYEEFLEKRGKVSLIERHKVESQVI